LILSFLRFIFIINISFRSILKHNLPHQHLIFFIFILDNFLFKRFITRIIKRRFLFHLILIQIFKIQLVNHKMSFLIK